MLLKRLMMRMITRKMTSKMVRMPSFLNCDPSAQNKSWVGKLRFKILIKKFMKGFTSIDTLLQIIIYKAEFVSRIFNAGNLLPSCIGNGWIPIQN